MKLSYRALGESGWTEFGDDSAGDFILGFLPRMRGQAQVSGLFRAANQLVVARNNRVWTLDGIIEKAHANNALAVSFVQSQAAAVPDSVEVMIEESTTGTATQLILTPAVFVEFEPVVKGESSTIRYGFVGASLTQPVSGGS